MNKYLQALSVVPSMLLPAAIYALTMPFSSMDSVISAWRTASGDVTSLTIGHMIIVIALFCVGTEIIKATRMSALGMADHVASLALLLVMALAYIAAPGFGSAVFFILMLMQTVDVAIGVIVSVSVARRDFTGAPFGS